MYFDETGGRVGVNFIKQTISKYLTSNGEDCTYLTLLF